MAGSLLSTAGCAHNAESRGASAATAPAAPAAATARGPSIDGIPELGALWVMKGLHGDAAGATATNWYHHTATGTCMPRGFGRFLPRGEQQFAPDNVSVGLASKELLTLVSLYTYPAQGTFDAEFEEVAATVAHTCEGRAFASTAMTDPRFPGGGRIGACSHVVEGDLLAIEQVLLFRRDSWSFKARFTFPAQLMERAYSASMAIVEASFRPCGPPRLTT